MAHRERMSYYDIDQRAAQMYAPIDEYLKMTKRFSMKAMKRKYILLMCLYAFCSLIFAGLSVYFIVIEVYSPLIATVFFLVGFLFMLFHHMKHYGKEPDPDLVCCENIINTDGLENVYTDHSRAVEFTKQSIIGRSYVFIKRRTVVRIRDIERTEMTVKTIANENGNTDTYYFTIHVCDELGQRAYELETLHGGWNKREKRVAELRQILEARQKGI